MNPFSLLSIGAAGVSLLLAVWLLISGFSNQGQQTRWQEQQQELLNHQQTLQTLQQKAQMQQQQIQSGRQLAEQIGPEVLKDIGKSVIDKKNEKLKGLLAKYGVSVQEATPAPAPKPPTIPPAAPNP
jgi:hypothetical protein